MNDGDRPTTPAPTQGPARQTWPTPRQRSRLSDRHHLRPSEWDPVVDVTPGDELWLRGNLLATVAVLAAARRLKETFARPPRPSRSRGTARLVEGRRGQPELPCRFWGALTGKIPQTGP